MIPFSDFIDKETFKDLLIGRELVCGHISIILSFNKVGLKKLLTN